jgi:16S rRNA (adenine1518-N6/adenine1519-N6)-dimethyltransferase
MELDENIHRIISVHGFVPSKKFGQNFIINEEIIQKVIAAAELQPNDIVLEIGAGTGAVTRELQKKCSVVAVEVDLALFDVLQEELDQKNLTLLQGDFLTLDIPSFTKIVSFPPYNISAKIMQRLFSIEFEVGVLVFQKEFVNKLTAFPGFEEYNAVSVLTQYHFVPEIVCHVSKRSFYPGPQSDSAAVKLVRKKTHGESKDDEKFHVFIKQLFRHGKNNLAKALHLSFPFIEDVLAVQEDELQKACESFECIDTKVNQLEIEEIVAVFNKLV